MYKQGPYLLRTAPVVEGASKDYRDFADLLEKIDELLVVTGVEESLIKTAIRRLPKGKTKKDWFVRFRQVVTFQIRTVLLRKLIGMDYRAFSVISSDSALIQWFLRRGTLEGFGGGVLGNGLSKSALERYDKAITAEDIEDAVRKLNLAVSTDKIAEKVGGLDAGLNVRELYADCTCLESNIHFPVDWVLLRDAVRTMVLAIECIRRHGMKHRIREPKLFLREINQLCIAMSASGRKKDGGKKRKKTLRAMLTVVTIVKAHAERYRRLLEQQWQTKTDFSKAEAGQVIKRLDDVLARLPAAMEQARKRILDGKKVVDAEKVLSLYEPDVYVIFRGKSGAEVEFGNTLYIAESRDGLIVDFEFCRGRPLSDAKLLEASVDRCIKAYGSIDSITTDRGFSSPDTAKKLTTCNIDNNVLPKSPRLMAKALSDERFQESQRRRAQTEGRIGILKNVFIGESLSGKGYAHQRLEVAWSILAHNLWVIARIALARIAEDEGLSKIPKSA